MTFVLSLIGRPNVGKSTLFNRLIGYNRSLTHKDPGLTRDRIYATTTYKDKPFLLIDTGGIYPKNNSLFMLAVKNQIEIALSESNAILFVVDAKAGVTGEDLEIANYLRIVNKPIYLVVNKTENKMDTITSSEFYKLGFKLVFSISAIHGIGINILKNEIFSNNSSTQKCETLEIKNDYKNLSLAIIGKPNVGKSTFFNKLLGRERLLVSPHAGTTFDYVDEKFIYNNYVFSLIDTAGIRKKNTIFRETEKMAVSAALQGIDRADIVVLMLDASFGISEQDIKIASFANKKSKGVVIVVNKSDLLKKTQKQKEKIQNDIKNKLFFLNCAPILFISSITGRNIFKVLQIAIEVFKNYTKRISTGALNKTLRRIILSHQLITSADIPVKIFYVTQADIAPPTFLFSVNNNTGIHFSYKRFLINQIRSLFGFYGTPIRIIFRERS